MSLKVEDGDLVVIDQLAAGGVDIKMLLKNV